MGELHLDVIVRRMKEEFGIDLLVGKPQVVYKETIEHAATVEHAFEKVINGVPCRAQVALSLAPLARGKGIEVVSRIAAAAPEAAYLPAMEEGVREALQLGPLKGFPMTDMRIEVLKASFSNPEFARLTLKMAAYEGFRQACEDARPALLVPIMSLTVTTPNEFMGEIIADLGMRKSQVTNIAAKDRVTVVQAHAPLTKMFGYSTDIRSLSQGRASFSMYFSHYDRIENE
jgi:elongation factor G